MKQAYDSATPRIDSELIHAVFHEKKKVTWILRLEVNATQSNPAELACSAHSFFLSPLFSVSV